MAKFKVEFNIDKCKGCELCVSFCPKKIIVLDQSMTNAKGYHPASITDMDACIGCSTCATMCPDWCINIWKEEA